MTSSARRGWNGISPTRESPTRASRHSLRRWGACAAQESRVREAASCSLCCRLRGDKPGQTSSGPVRWFSSGSCRRRYAGGCFAFDVNVVWVPAALPSRRTIDSALRRDRRAGNRRPPSPSRVRRKLAGSARHFMVALDRPTSNRPCVPNSGSLPEVERRTGSVLTHTQFRPDTFAFPAVSLDSAASPPVMAAIRDVLLLERQPAERRPSCCGRFSFRIQSACSSTR